MRRLALFAPLLILALAQVEPLRRALQAHGFQGREVRALYQEDRLTLYTPQGQVAEVGLSRAWLDPKGCRYRQEVLPGGREEGRSVVLFTPALQALLLPDGRRVPLPDPLLLIRENPYAKEHGEEKHAKMRELLKDVALKVGARFGHGGSLGAFPVADRVEVGAVSLEEALSRLKERSSA